MATPLESLLNLKRWEEDEAKNRFAILLKELAVEEGVLLDLEENYSGMSEKIKAGRDMPTTIGEIKRQREFLGFLLERINGQEEVIRQKGLLVEAARQLLAEVAKERKTFERLDEKRKESSRKEAERKEQIVTDEHASSGHQRNKL